MNLSLIFDIPDNVRKLNRDKVFRQHVAHIADDYGEKIVLAVINSDSLTPEEKQARLSDWALCDTSLRIQMVRYGQREWGFPRYPISNRFLDWYMNLSLSGGAIERYIWLIVTIMVGDSVLTAISNGDLEIPSVLNDLAEIATANSSRLQQTMRDFLASCDPTTEMPTFSQDAAIERLANALAKPFVSKANRIINDGENRWNDGLEGAWKGSRKLLERSALENFHKAFASSELQNYLAKAIKNQLGQEVRRIQRDKARREAQGYEEIIESDSPLVLDDEGNWGSPLELIPEILQEDMESVGRGLLEALQLTEKELAIWEMKLEGKTKKQIAKKVGISRPTLDNYLKVIREKIRDLQSDDLGISLSDLFRPGSIKIHGKWQPTPDPTPYRAMVNLIRENLNELTR